MEELQQRIAKPFLTEFEFVLPYGYITSDNQIIREGRMKLITGGDEISLTKDITLNRGTEDFKRAQAPIILLAKAITQLGHLKDDEIDPDLILQLFVGDIKFLKEFYQKINFDIGSKKLVVCPQCKHKFEEDIVGNDSGDLD
jgi:hypothetical protein